MPVSITRNRIVARLAFVMDSTSSLTLPDCANFEALLNRLNKHWLAGNVGMHLAGIGGTVHCEGIAVLPCDRLDHAGRLGHQLFDAEGFQKQIDLARLDFERSKMSLIRWSRCLPAAWIFCKSGMNSGCWASPASSCSISL